MLGWAQDVVQTADHLGFETFGLIAASGGGPHALACAYAIPGRLVFTAVMGSWAPVANTELAREMAPLDQFFSKLATRAPFLFSLPFSWFLLSSRYLSPDLFVKSIDSSLCDADRQILADPKFSSFFKKDIKEAFAQGVCGPADETVLLYQDWGFDLGDIHLPVLIIHGEEDKFAPISFGEFLHACLPNSRLKKYPGQGHIFLVTIFDRLFELITV